MPMEKSHDLALHSEKKLGGELTRVAVAAKDFEQLFSARLRLARILDCKVRTDIVNDGQVAYTKIGKFCSIAAMVRINPGNHPMQRASQAHFTYRASAYFPGEADEAEFFAWRRSFPVEIGHDVWIGHGAVILPGRRVGTGAIVGAGVIVTKDVPPYSIVVGNPARQVRARFPEEIGNRLQKLAW